MPSLADSRLCYYEAAAQSFPSDGGPVPFIEPAAPIQEPSERDLFTTEACEKRYALLVMLKLYRLFSENELLTLEGLRARGIPLADLAVEGLSDEDAFILFGKDFTRMDLIDGKKILPQMRQEILATLGLADKGIDTRWPLAMNDFTSRGILTATIDFEELKKTPKRVEILFGKGIALIRKEIGKRMNPVWILSDTGEEPVAEKPAQQGAGNPTMADLAAKHHELLQQKKAIEEKRDKS